MPSMMWGIGSEPVASMKTSAVSGLTRSAWRTTTVPRSKGPTLAAVIATTESGGAVVGAGEVDLAGGVDLRTEPTPAPTSVRPTGRRPGTKGWRAPGRRCLDLAAASAASGQTATPGELADQAGRQLDREVGELLFAVVAGEAEVKGE